MKRLSAKIIVLADVMNAFGRGSIAGYEDVLAMSN
jgi:hypothetical protein